MNEKSEPKSDVQANLLAKYNVWLLSFISAIALFAPMLGLAYVNSRVWFLILLLPLGWWVRVLLTKWGWVAWIFFAASLIVVWIVPLYFSLAISGIQLVTLFTLGLIIGGIWAWTGPVKWGIWAGATIFTGLVAIQLFSAYQLTFPWQYSRAIERQNGAVTLPLDQREHPGEEMLRNIILSGNNVYITKGPDRKNNAHSLVIGDPRTNDWRFFGLGSSQALTLGPDDRWVIIGEASEDRIVKYDPATGEAVAAIKIQKPVNCLYNGILNRQFCISENPHSFFELDPETMQIGKSHTIDSVQLVYGMDVDRQAQRVFLGCEGKLTGHVAMHSVNDFTLLAENKVGRSFIWGLLLSKSEESLYVTLPLVNYVAVLDANTLELKGKLNTGRGVRDIIEHPSKPILYAGNFFKGTVVAIDLETGGRLWEIYTGPRVRGLTVDTANNILYAASGLGLAAIDLAAAYGDLDK